MLPRQASIERGRHGVDDPQTGVHGARRIVLVGHRPAEVDQQPVTQILGDGAIKLVDGCGRGALVGTHDLTLVFGIELLSEGGRVGDIAKHHGELPPFGLGGAVFLGWRQGPGHRGRLGRGDRQFSLPAGRSTLRRQKGRVSGGFGKIRSL
jgi:hypothetical protein